MHTTSSARHFLRQTRWLLLLLLLSSGVRPAQAMTIRTGDAVTNFTLVARQPFTRPDGTLVPAGGTVHLRDFAGRIVFLEWFAVWCPYCVAAAPQVESGIVNYYAGRGGNRYGVPVLHIAINQEPRSAYTAQTDAFVKQQGFKTVVNDYDATSTNQVRFLFQSSGQPIFVLINGLTNSPTHQPWQLLSNHLGYGQTDFNQVLAGFRTVIDSVQPAIVQPELVNQRLTNSAFEFQLLSQPGRTWLLQSSTNSADWVTLKTVTPTNASTWIRDTGAPAPRRFYRAVLP